MYYTSIFITYLLLYFSGPTFAEDNSAPKNDLFTFKQSVKLTAIKVEPNGTITQDTENEPEYTFEAGSLIKGQVVQNGKYVFVPLKLDNIDSREGFLIKVDSEETGEAAIGTTYTKKTQLLVPATAGTKTGLGDTLKTPRDSTVYFDSHQELYGKVSVDPTYSSMEKAENDPNSPFVASKDKLVVSDTSFTNIPDPNTGMSKLTILYKVPARTNSKSCTPLVNEHDLQSFNKDCKTEGWINSENVIETPREPSLFAQNRANNSKEHKKVCPDDNQLKKSVAQSIPDVHPTKKKSLADINSKSSNIKVGMCSPEAKAFKEKVIKIRKKLVPPGQAWTQAKKKKAMALQKKEFSAQFGD